HLGQAPVADAQNDFDVDQFLNDDADFDANFDADDFDVQAPQQPPQQRNVEEEGYGGGPRDLSLLSDYHKHTTIPIWDARRGGFGVRLKQRGWSRLPGP
ncbi:hypothetical protein A2U01_0073650, partial [Trifolium medium]|nr:hypothetical protein [Trifolium medium]